MTSQIKHEEWNRQWTIFDDQELFLFKDWIAPYTLEDFKGKDVLECGCGGGQHTSFLAPLVKSIVAVDLNTVAIARERNKRFANVECIEGDIAAMDLARTFDIVFSIGVVHHTDDPDKTVENLLRHVKPGGILIVWVYSKEGNFLARKVVEPFRNYFLKRFSREFVLVVSKVITLMLYLPIYTIYLLPMKFLPYHAYFANFRKLSFNRNLLNVFDKLNAPQVQFISKERITGWFDAQTFECSAISSYNNVSWRGSGRIRYQS
jgi:SAM-dependent methyltransferase